MATSYDNLGIMLIANSCATSDAQTEGIRRAKFYQRAKIKYSSRILASLLILRSSRTIVFVCKGAPAARLRARAPASPRMMTSAFGSTRTCGRGRLMSAIGTTADVICSERVFRLLTQLRHSNHSKRRCTISFDWRNGTHPRNDGVEVLLGHLAEKGLPRHWRLEHAAVATDALGQHTLEFGIEVTPADAGEISKLIEVFAKVYETAELAERIEQLERMSTHDRAQL